MTLAEQISDQYDICRHFNPLALRDSPNFLFMTDNTVSIISLMIFVFIKRLSDSSSNNIQRCVFASFMNRKK